MKIGNHQLPVRLLRALAAVVIAAGSGITVEAASLFNFDADPLGTNTKFTDTSNGISATFSSTSDPGGFAVLPSLFQTLTGNVLGDPGAAGQNGISLDITFNTNLSAISLNFATADFGAPSPLTLNAFENGKLVGTAAATGMLLNGFTFPEGEIAFSGANFNEVLLSSPAPDFAIDNVTVAGAAATPEPGAVLLMGLGFCGLGVMRLRRKTN